MFNKKQKEETEGLLSQRLKKNNVVQGNGDSFNGIDNSFIINTNQINAETTVFQQDNDSGLLRNKINPRKAQNQDIHQENFQKNEFIVNTSDDNFQQQTISESDTPFANGYVSPYTKQTAKKKEKKKKEEKIYSGTDGSPFVTKIDKRTKLFIIIGIIVFVLLLPQIIFRIPPLFAKNDSQKYGTVNNATASALSDFISKNAEDDWDNDGIPNSTDKSPWNPDTDLNGIPDGNQVKTIASKDSPITITYEGITAELTSNKSGIGVFKNYYVFNNFKGWVKCNTSNLIPFIHTDNGWKIAKYKEENGSLYVYIPCDCYVEFSEVKLNQITATDLFGGFAYSENGTRYSNGIGFFKNIANVFFYSFLPSTENTDKTISCIWSTDEFHYKESLNPKTSDATIPDTSSYSFDSLKNYEMSYTKLDKVYNAIDNKRTVLASMIDDEGENTIFIYGYDYLGNLYAADASTGKLLGTIKITPRCQIYDTGNEKYMRQWYEFDGLGYSSQDNGNLFFFTTN